MQGMSWIQAIKTWKSQMKYDFFCDENITKKLQNTIKKFGFETDSVRNQKIFGLSNGELVKYLNSRNKILITFDKDFLKTELSLEQGVIIIDVNPNRDEFTVPILERFLNILKTEKIDLKGKKILLNQEFLSNFK